MFLQNWLNLIFNSSNSTKLLFVKAEEKALFLNIYNKLLADKKDLEVLLQTYFGDVRDVYADNEKLPVVRWSW